MLKRVYLSVGLLLSVQTLLSVRAFSEGLGTTGAQTLLESPSSRATALGEAFSAMGDDVSAFAYNPASLATLQSHQLSFLYDKGMFDDHYSRLDLGFMNGWGFSAGYFDAGTADLFDGQTRQTVSTQKDLAASLGYGHSFGAMKAGLSAKYLSTTLAETDNATAVAGDVGLQWVPGNSFSFGAAVQNLGTSLKYSGHASPLPLMARAGVAVHFFSQAPTTLLLDLPYEMKTKQWRTGVGIETRIGLMSLRAGYQSGSTLQGLSLGAGINMKSASLDYAFGFVDGLSSSQRVSLTYHFGTKEKVRS